MPRKKDEYVPLEDDEVPTVEDMENLADDIMQSVLSPEIPEEEMPPFLPDPPAIEPPKKYDMTTETVLVRFDLNDNESAALGKQLSRSMVKLAMTEAELTSIKNDYKAKLEKLECEADRIKNIILDGFDMRPVNAVVMLKLDPATRALEKVYYKQSDGTFIKTELADSTCELDMFAMLPKGHNVTDPLPEAFRVSS